MGGQITVNQKNFDYGSGKKHKIIDKIQYSQMPIYLDSNIGDRYYT